MPSPPFKLEEEESGSESEQKTAHQINQQDPPKIFQDDHGNPVCFFLHNSIREKSTKDILTDMIESRGGHIQDTDFQVDTVLIDPERCVQENLQLTYNGNFDRSKRDTWVEPKSFVKRCIRENIVRHHQSQPKGMGGSLRSYRVPFTPEDDNNIARYLAIKIPDASAGGRRGNGVYQELEVASTEDPEGFAWVKRHPWSSWRNHVNKDIDRFNDLIDHYAKLEKSGRKHAYGLRRKSHKRQYSSSEVEEIDEVPAAPTKRRRVDSSPEPVKNLSLAEIHGQRSPTRKGKERAFAEDGEEQWAPHSPFQDQNEDQNEPGPSQRTPKKTYADRGVRRTHVIMPSHVMEPETPQATLVPQTSQATLVGPGTQIEQPRSRDVAISSSPTVAKRSAASKSTASLEYKPMAIKMARRRKDQLLSSTPATTEAPYRNTRSRSRSIEPSIVPLRPKPQRKKTEPLPQLEEMTNEEDRQSTRLELGNMSGHLGQSLAEEQDVEDFLVNSISGRSHETNNERADGEDQSAAVQSSEAEAGSESDSMDSDDAQTDQLLRQPIQAVTPEDIEIDPGEMLRQFQEAPTNSALFSRRSSAIRQPRPQTDPFVNSRHGVLGPNRTPPRQQQPPTPDNRSFRRDSSSSVQSFPVAGTKASAVKKRIETQEKQTPYRPPAGTRAALLMTGGRR